MNDTISKLSWAMEPKGTLGLKKCQKRGRQTGGCKESRAKSNEQEMYQKKPHGKLQIAHGGEKWPKTPFGEKKSFKRRAGKPWIKKTPRGKLPEQVTTKFGGGTQH